MTRRSLPPKLAALGLAAVLTITACGKAEPSANSLPKPGDIDPSGELRSPTPINITGTGDGTAGGGKLASPEAAATDMSMPYMVVEYVLGDVGELPTNDVGYVFPAGAAATVEQVAAIAAALGVEGEPVPGDPSMGASWQVGPVDGSAPAITVGTDAQLSWWFNSAWSQGVRAAEGCAMPAMPEGSSEDVPVVTCPEPTPPPGVPTKDEAEARAREIMAALGEDPETLTFTTYGDEWYASVEAAAPLAGVEMSPIRWSFGFGENGVLQYAGGVLARPEPVGPYPLIDVDTAFVRLQDQSGMWLGMGGGLMDGGVARGDVAVMSEASPATDVAAPPPSDVTVEPMPVPDPSMPEPPMPETLTVTLVGVEADLWWAWDADGSVWLLPAYRFIGDDGGWYTVPAVTDEFLIVEPVIEPMPLPVEPGVGGGGSPGDPGETPAPTAAPVETPAPTVEPDMTLFDATQLEPFLGLSLADFTAEATGLGASVRVVEEDGVALAVTEDYSPTRVNVAVEGGVVTRIVNVG